MSEICIELKEYLLHETNTLLSLSSRDRHVMQVASELNKQLRILRKQHQQ